MSGGSFPSCEGRLGDSWERFNRPLSEAGVARDEQPRACLKIVSCRIPRPSGNSDRESGGHFAVSFADSALGDVPGIRLPGVAEMAQKTLVEGLT